MMSVPITVVIPTYNSERFIKATLQAIFAQTKLPTEIIVVDDGSSDRTLEIIAELSATAPCKVRLIKTPANTGGPGGPIKLGISEAQTEFVTINEQDDLMEPVKLERVMGCFQALPDATMVISSFMVDRLFGDFASCKEGLFRGSRSVFDEISKKRIAGTFFELDGADVYDAMLRRGTVFYSLSNVTLRLPLEEDWYFGLKLAVDAGLTYAQARGRIGFVDETLWRYQHHSASFSNTAGRVTIDIDEVSILEHEYSRCLPRLRDAVREKYRRTLLCAGWRLGNAGKFRESVSCYLRLLSIRPYSFGAILGLAKLVPKFVIRRLTHNAVGLARRAKLSQLEVSQQWDSGHAAR